MKKNILLTIVSFVIFQFGLNAQSITGEPQTGELENPGSKAAVEWENIVFDFGKIKKNHPETCSFTFKNTGTLPVILIKARASCGCTGIKYPREAIRPGETGTIQVTYDAASLGAFNKSVMVEFNFENSHKTLRLKGVVVENPEN
ncbi:MAG: DUF1573 domain-containing protein [Bacteroidales bacterium]|nr:DUF1573 domain-containing protein [Bacteroidales bacterium]